MEVCGKRAEYVSEPCDLCLLDGLSTQADGYCNECEEHMCNKCFQHHVKVKSCRNHVLSPLGQSVLHGKKQTGNNDKCKIHVKENVKYYCRKHDMVTCGDCNVANHNGCKMEFIGNLAKQFENSTEFKDIRRKIEKLETEHKDNRAQLESNRKENRARLDTALAEIKKFRKDINEHLDIVEKEIMVEANKMAKQNDDIIDQIEKMLSVAEQEILDIRNNLDAGIIHGDALFIRTKEYKPKLSKVDESVSLIRTKNVIEGFTFEQEKQFADMVKSGVKLGCLRRDIFMKEKPTVIQKTKRHIETVNTGTSVTAEKQVAAKQSHLLTEEASTVPQKNSQSIETVKQLLPVTAEKNVKAKQSYLPPDPRAAGFDVGSRVKDIRPFYELLGWERPLYGTVTNVHPDGYVDVQWDNGHFEKRVYAGARGEFDVTLMS